MKIEKLFKVAPVVLVLFVTFQLAVSQEIAGSSSIGNIQGIIIDNVNLNKPYRIDLYRIFNTDSLLLGDSLTIVNKFYSDSESIDIINIRDVQTGQYKILVEPYSGGAYPGIVDNMEVIKDSTSIIICCIGRVNRFAFQYGEFRYPYDTCWTRWVVSNDDTLWKHQWFDTLRTMERPKWKRKKQKRELNAR